jgi:hypothetical protein
MSGGHVLYSGRLPGKVTIAFLAVIMISTLRVVLPSRVSALKVEIAVIAGPMGIGILFVLL